MAIKLIAALGLNRGIGKNGGLLWKLPNDMAFFTSTTKGAVVITGRKNYESIPHKFRPLPGRDNIVITRQTNYRAAGVDVAHSLEESLEIAKEKPRKDIFIIGGSEIYRLALENDVCQTMYLTWVDDSPSADAFFPEFDTRLWKRSELQYHNPDEKHAHAFVVCQYDKL